MANFDALRSSEILPSGEDAKILGAFYTDTQIAEFLVRWAVRSKDDRVLDPSLGGGVFLRAACERITTLHGTPSSQVYGIEIDRNVHVRIRDKLVDEFGVKRSNLRNSDFFDTERSQFEKIDVVVGNPPFIRYQRFNGDSRRKALEKSLENGVQLSKLASSWAPFVVHGVSFLKQGGRLAFVIPMEVAYTAYSIPILKFLHNSFREVTFLTFQKKLFPDLNEDTLLLLADDKGHGPGKFLTRDFSHAGMLRYQEFKNTSEVFDRTEIDSRALTEAERRLIEYILPVSIRDLYGELKTNTLVSTLGCLADVGIGYVTGNNKFFHLSPTEAKGWKIPSKFLRPAVRRGKSLASLRFTDDDWASGLESDDTCYLLNVPNGQSLGKGLRAYIEHGESAGVPRAYKCRTREPWYSVPHVHQPDAFLSYMSGDTPKLVANDTSAVAPNSLHVVRMHPQSSVTSGVLAALWQTSLTRLSCEIEGHSLGGGMLKLEPTEAEKVLIGLIGNSTNECDGLALELDLLARRGQQNLVRDLADEFILVKSMGLSRNECRLLAEGASILHARRTGRGKAV